MCRQSYFFGGILQMIRDKVKKARMAYGYTQEEMAVILGVDRSTYTYYETGKVDMPVKALLAVSAIFDIAIEWFFVSDEEKPVTKKPSLKESAPMVLRSPSVFIPQTMVEGYLEEEPEDEQQAEIYGIESLSSDERVFIARYRIARECGRGEEVDEWLRKTVEEEMSKI